MWELRMEVWKDYFMGILGGVENRIIKGVGRDKKEDRRREELVERRQRK